MAKQNTKASSTQLSQDVAAADAAAAVQQEQSQDTSAPGQDSTGVADQSQEQPVQGETINSGEGAEQIEGQDSKPATAPVQQPETKDIVVEPVAPVAVAPVAKSAPAVVVVEASTPVAADATLQEKLSQILKDVPSTYQIDISRILSYLERMAPGRPVDVKTGSAEQTALYKSIQNIINRQEQYFTQLFSAVLFIFKSEAKGALGDRYRMRFMDNIVLAAGDRKAFANITQMLAILADPKSRELGMKQVNLEKALENGLTAEGRNRVLHYFGA